jgi:hypothetical protein
MFCIAVDLTNVNSLPCFSHNHKSIPHDVCGVRGGEEGKKNEFRSGESVIILLNFQVSEAVFSSDWREVKYGELQHILVFFSLL